MIHATFLFSRSADPQAVDEYVTRYVLGALEGAPGVLSVTTNEAPILSAAGRPQYTRIVQATLSSMDDWVAIGQSALVQGSLEATPPGTQILFYEADPA